MINTLFQIIDDDVKANEGEKHVYERLMRKILETLHLFHLSSTDGKPATSFDVNFYRLILHRTYELLDKVKQMMSHTFNVGVVVLM